MPDFSPDAIFWMALRVPIILLALTVHEWAHAYSAMRLGDPTARNQGRVTLNPLAHLDPIGTLCLLFAPIGWAKPVPVNPLNFRNPGRDDIIVSAAGPASNLAQAFIFALLLNLPWREWAWNGPANHVMDARGMQQIAWILWIVISMGVLLNVGLTLFNMLPLYPLDGHHIARENLRGQARETFIRVQPYSIFILVGLVVLENFTEFRVISWPIYKLAAAIVTLLTGSTASSALVL